MIYKIARYVAVLVIAIISINSLGAEEVPLLESKGKKQQCASLANWTNMMVDLGGEHIHSGSVMNYNVLKTIKPTFADNIFAPLIGKSFRDLTKRDRKKISKAIRNCRSKMQISSFLEIPFRTGRGARSGDYIGWVEVLSKVTNEDGNRAKAMVAKRDESKRLAQVDRPQTKVRQFATNKAARKTHKIETKACYAQQSGWRYQLNDYVFDGYKVVRRPDYLDGYHDCKSGLNRNFVVPNIFSLAQMDNGLAELFVIGDICAAKPAILYLHPRSKLPLPKYGEDIPVTGQFGSPYFHSTPYPYYVASGTDGINVRLNKVEIGLLATREIIENQCGILPQKIRVYGATIAGKTPRSISLAYRNKRYNRPAPEFAYEQFYAGTFNPGLPKKRLTHDDHRLSEVYIALAKKRSAFISDKAFEKAKREELAVYGAGYFALMLLGIHSASPCNDPHLTYSEKPPACRH